MINRPTTARHFVIERADFTRFVLAALIAGMAIGMAIAASLT